MTRIGYAKPLTFQTPPRPSQRPPNVGLRFRSLSSCELQPTSRFEASSFRLETGSPSVLVPHSAIIIRRDIRASTLVASRLQVFATSWREDVRDDLQVYSTLQALQGLGAFRDLPQIDHWVFPASVLLRRYLAFHGYLPANSGFPRPRRMGVSPYDLISPAPDRPAAAGSVCGLGRP